MQKKELISILKNKGFKATKPRVFVLYFLAKAKKPFSVKEITEQAKKENIDQVTVYRTLESFKKSGIAQEINFQENRAFFELKDEKQDHHHIVCVKCKKVKDFLGCEYKKLADKIIKNNSDFAKITNHSFEFFGICKACI